MAFALVGIIFVIVMMFLKDGNSVSSGNTGGAGKNAHLVETIYGMRTIKSLALEGRRRKDGIAMSLWPPPLAMNSAMANYPQTLTLPFDHLIIPGCLAVGAYIVLTSPNSISRVFWSPLLVIEALGCAAGQASDAQQDLAEVRGAVNEVASIMNVPPEVRTNGLRAPIKGEISFQDVRFRYIAGASYAR